MINLLQNQLYIERKRLTEHWDDEEDFGHHFIVSGGEVVDLNEKVPPQPIDTSIRFNMPVWMRNYRKALKEKMAEQEKIETMLYQLHDYEQILLDIKLKQQELVDQLITPDVKKAVDDIHTEFVPRLQTAAYAIETLKQAIREEVLKLGHTVENEYYQVQWKKGRSGGFDTGMLEGMARLIPQINDARKPDGEPTVSFNPKK